MSVVEKKKGYTAEEYLALEQDAEFRSEFYNGEIFAMSGGSRNHSVISVNALAELRNRLMGKDCTVTGSDLKVRIESENAFVYPDAHVICGEEQYWNERTDVVSNPLLVVEVLSDSTELYDRGGKFRKYETLASLREYVLIGQNEAHVEVYYREPGGIWQFRRFEGMDGELELKSVSVRIPMKLIYHHVDFPELPLEPSQEA